MRDPPDFDGSDAGWREWVFAFESCAGLLDLDGLMDSAVGRSSARVNDQDAGALDNGLREKSRLLYHVLVQLLRGKAASIARSAERQNGADIWRLL